ncbi:DUF305 domain-containing protein [Saccharopolyspora sp. NFXS83]|uniref:DUF305 domain-containing protein n=1 Tax=Saccharopolyspora sp. NFXS83 TaxID=2993560 RepID=UPI00224A92FD|nr:DUF305 domain-containing protein [Saccharopolyspora sp. NFXS83]MCX2729907.1 DUF305 domain-containing protein [Saccharopolyspora sp. NFXS83]
MFGRVAAGRARGSAAGCCLAALLAAAGCTSEPGAAPEEPAGAPVVLPGAPGDEPSVVPSLDRDRLASAEPVQAEADYVRMMIVHHEQAVRMTDLAETRAENPSVRSLAARIGAAQPAEIGAMRGWLATHDLPEQAQGSGHEGHSGHGHSGHGAEPGPMPGMATPEQLAALEASGGAEFDRLFLRLMTAHHEGAVAMATDVLATGRDEQLHEMAQDVLVTQTDEIATMRGLAAGG